MDSKGIAQYLVDLEALIAAVIALKLIFDKAFPVKGGSNQMVEEEEKKDG
tara:strand:+ start:1373 stop:1522 length:150 start_codon:yes stop_codon:yes gene_type:complete